MDQASPNSRLTMVMSALSPSPSSPFHEDQDEDAGYSSVEDEIDPVVSSTPSMLVVNSTPSMLTLGEHWRVELRKLLSFYLRDPVVLAGFIAEGLTRSRDISSVSLVNLQEDGISTELVAGCMHSMSRESGWEV
eukprot:GILI01050864.1.p1 GENE.GILI01050864.1~~GILI01050864.1.p1  ORF type:complete len:134 (+),score=19.81 GILI01050864.1:121-522(+)